MSIPDFVAIKELFGTEVKFAEAFERECSILKVMPSSSSSSFSSSSPFFGDLLSLHLALHQLPLFTRLIVCFLLVDLFLCFFFIRNPIAEWALSMDASLPLSKQALTECYIAATRAPQYCAVCGQLCHSAARHVRLS
jgi:hypothetical protein